MTTPSPPAPEPNAVLYFKATCPPCRYIARIVHLLCGKSVRLVSIEQSEARNFFSAHPAYDGLPVMCDGPRVTAGWWILAALPGVTARNIARRLKALSRLIPLRNSRGDAGGD
ncbi:MAG: hypothetical protein P8011_09990 [Acidihalobacter sp.]